MEDSSNPLPSSDSLISTASHRDFLLLNCQPIKTFAHPSTMDGWFLSTGNVCPPPPVSREFIRMCPSFLHVAWRKEHDDTVGFSHDYTCRISCALRQKIRGRWSTFRTSVPFVCAIAILAAAWFGSLAVPVDATRDRLVVNIPAPFIRLVSHLSHCPETSSLHLREIDTVFGRSSSEDRGAL